MYTASDYAPLLFGSGAAKLADSGVAPLVAAARGYRSFRGADRKELVQTARANSTKVRQTAKWFPVEDADVLLLPWMRANITYEGHLDPTQATYFQVRPSHPREGDDGRVAKYDGFQGGSTPLDVHPSAGTWMRTASKVLLTEGVLKGDAALSALLKTAGVGDAELALPAGFDAENAAEWHRDAAARLAVLMDTVPTAKRHVIVSVVGVQNWRSQSNSLEWQSLPLRDGTVFVAFDGDLRTNPDVHKRAVELFAAVDSRGGVAKLLDLGGEVALMHAREAGYDGKLGLDDYLSHTGRGWDDAIGLATIDLPPAPAAKKAEAQRGDVRNSPDGTRVEEYSVSSDGRGYWTEIDRCAGRVLSITEARTPTYAETLTGYTDPKVTATASDRRVEVEVTYSADGEVRREVVVGTGRVLEHEPTLWSSSRETAYVPPTLASQSAWPPDSKLRWVRAMKAASGEIDFRRAWTQQGWVPGAREGDHPVFLIGKQTLGQTPEQERSIRNGVDESFIPGIERFGLIDRFRDLEQDDYQALVRRAIEHTVATYVHGIWDETRAPGHGPIILAAMLRPAVPTPWQGVLWLTGPPGKGKSAAAAFALRGWSEKPGMWTLSSLPSTGSGSKRAQEIAQGRSAIWVIDDVQPGDDRGDSMEKILDDIVRQQASGAARRVSTQDNRLRQDPPPKALMIVSAEISLSAASARQRVITLEFPERLTTNFDAFANDILDTAEGEYPAIVTAALARYFLGTVAGASTWRDKLEVVTNVRRGVEERVTDRLTKAGLDAADVSRAAKLIAGLLLALTFLKNLYRSVGGDDAATLAALDWDEPNGAPQRAIAHSIRAFHTQESDTLGARLVTGLVDVLGSGRAHVLGPEAGAPPFGDAKDAWMNEQLGWRRRNNAWEARGETIGSAGMIKGNPCVVFSHRAAFRAAQALRDGTVAAGQSMGNTWTAAVTTGLVRASATYRFQDHSDQRATGYLASFYALFGIEAPADDEVDEAA